MGFRIPGRRGKLPAWEDPCGPECRGAVGMAGLRRGLAVLLLLAGTSAYPQTAEDCRDAEVGTICDARSAARYLLHVAGELEASRQWCLALGADAVAWRVALDFWVRRNRNYLDAAARIASGGEEERFNLDGPLLEHHEPAIPVTEAQCGRDLRHIDEGRFDVDLEPALRPLKRYLAGD